MSDQEGRGLGLRSRLWKRIVRFLGRTRIRNVEGANEADSGVTFYKCGVSNEITNGDRVLRRFIDSPNHLEWDSDNSRYVPAGNQMIFDSDTPEEARDLSTYWREHLGRDELGPEALLIGHSNYSLIGEWRVAAVRKLKFPVAHTPRGDVPIECAHASICWPPDSIPPSKMEPSPSRRRILRGELSRELSWAYGTISTPPPEGA